MSGSKTGILLALWIGWILPLMAQPDSLLQSLEQEPDLEKRYDRLSEYAWSLKYTAPDSFRWWSDSLVKAGSVHLLPRIEGVGYSYIGVYFYIQGDYDSALYFLEEAKNRFAENDLPKNMAKTYNYMGLVYDNLDDHDLALEYYFKSLHIKERFEDNRGIANCLNNIGSVHLDNDEYEQARDYFEQSLTLYLALGQEDGLARSYNNLGLVYHRQEQFDEAIEYYLKSLEIEERLGVDLDGIALSYNNIGSLYSKQGQFEVAAYYYLKAKEIYERMQAKHGLSLVLNNLSDVKRSLGKIDMALQDAEQALQLARGSGSLDEQKRAYLNLALAHKEKKDYENSLLNYEAYVFLNDSLIREERSAEISGMEKRLTYRENYRGMKLEQHAAKNRQKQRNITWILVAGDALLLLILLGMGPRRGRLWLRQAVLLVFSALLATIVWLTLENQLGTGNPGEPYPRIAWHLILLAGVVVIHTGLSRWLNPRA